MFVLAWLCSFVAEIDLHSSGRLTWVFFTFIGLMKNQHAWQYATEWA